MPEEIAWCGEVFMSDLDLRTPGTLPDFRLNGRERILSKITTRSGINRFAGCWPSLRSAQWAQASTSFLIESQSAASPVSFVAESELS